MDIHTRRDLHIKRYGAYVVLSKCRFFLPGFGTGAKYGTGIVLLSAKFDFTVRRRFEKKDTS